MLTEKEKRKALIRLDLDALHQLMPNIARESVLIAAHKMRYENTSLPKELRHASGQFLRENGYGRIYGMELLPEGELPSAVTHRRLS